MKTLDIASALMIPVALLFVVTQILIPHVVEEDAFRKSVWTCQDEIGDYSQAGWDFCVESIQDTHIEDGC